MPIAFFNLGATRLIIDLIVDLLALEWSIEMDNLIAWWHLLNTASNWVVIAIAANFCIVVSLVAGCALEDKLESFSIAMLKIAMISIIATVVSLAFALIVSAGFSDHPVNPNSYLSRIAHQKTVKPYRYYLDGDKLYYQLSKDSTVSSLPIKLIIRRLK